MTHPDGISKILFARIWPSRLPPLILTSTTMTLDVGDIHDPTSTAYKKARRKHWKSTRNRPDNVDADWTPFRAAEKKYKAKFPPPDLSSVLDLAAADPSREEETIRGGWRGRPDAVECTEISLHDGTGAGDGRKAYVFPGTPGARLPCVPCRWAVCVHVHCAQYIRLGPPPVFCAAR